jgi:hypothetical protein
MVWLKLGLSEKELTSAHYKIIFMSVLQFCQVIKAKSVLIVYLIKHFTSNWIGIGALTITNRSFIISEIKPGQAISE